MRLAPGEKSGDRSEKVGQGTGWLPVVWNLKWGRIWIPRGMQLDVNVDCGCEELTSLMSMSGSSLSEKRAHCGAASELYRQDHAKRKRPYIC